MIENRRTRLAVGMIGTLLTAVLVVVFWTRESKPERVRYQEPPPNPLDKYEYVHLRDLKGEFPNEVFRLHNLQLLIIEGAEFTSIPDSFHKLPYLVRVIIRNAPLDHIPPALFNGGKYFQYLTFSDCPIETIDPRVRKLGVLDVINGKLSTIPPELFDSISNLRHLNLPGNQIEKIPEEITRRYGLHRLGLSRNPIVEIPWVDTMWWRPNYIGLSRTNLERLPQKPGDGGMFLEYLDVRNTPLKEVPQAWRELENIKEIYE